LRQERGKTTKQFIFKKEVDYFLGHVTFNAHFNNAHIDEIYHIFHLPILCYELSFFEIDFLYRKRKIIIRGNSGV